MNIKENSVLDIPKDDDKLKTDRELLEEVRRNQANMMKSIASLTSAINSSDVLSIVIFL